MGYQIFTAEFLFYHYVIKIFQDLSERNVIFYSNLEKKTSEIAVKINVKSFCAETI